MTDQVLIPLFIAAMVIVVLALATQVVVVALHYRDKRREARAAQNSVTLFEEAGK